MYSVQRCLRTGSAVGASIAHRHGSIRQAKPIFGERVFYLSSPAVCGQRFREPWPQSPMRA